MFPDGNLKEVGGRVRRRSTALLVITGFYPCTWECRDHDHCNLKERKIGKKEWIVLDSQSNRGHHQIKRIVKSIIRIIMQTLAYTYSFLVYLITWPSRPSLPTRKNPFLPFDCRRGESFPFHRLHTTTSRVCATLQIVSTMMSTFKIPAATHCGHRFHQRNMRASQVWVATVRIHGHVCSKWLQ
jgi:hypothetical protein